MVCSFLLLVLVFSVVFLEIVQSDNGSSMIGWVTKECYRLFSVELRTSTPHYPQCNGQVEFINGELKYVILCTVKCE